MLPKKHSSIPERGKSWVMLKLMLLCRLYQAEAVEDFVFLGGKIPSTPEWFGVYYAAENIETAIKETMHHLTSFLSATKEGDTELTMRNYVTRVKQQLIDITSEAYIDHHHPDKYTVAQSFAKQARDVDEWGILYNSVRNAGCKNIAVLRPPAIDLNVQGCHYRYQWSGLKQAFTSYFQISDLTTLDI
ncbi:hypothetical protein A9Q81_03400 [Gammaproteobacteria bacterium 42_54_T18]|nr:hypothetical protein A9Q81_03400 [Gammaproteobacteria bacterium 42_54_T18]